MYPDEKVVAGGIAGASPGAPGAAGSAAAAPGPVAAVSWDGYEELFAELWERMTLVLGTTAGQVLMRRAMRDASGKYPILSHLTVSESGLGFDQMKEIAGPREPMTLSPAFWELILALFGILTKLTGSVLVGDLEKLVSERL